MANTKKKSKDKKKKNAGKQSNSAVRKDNGKASSGEKGVVVKETKGSREILAVILAAVGIFLIFSLFNKTGKLGELVIGFLVGLVGKFCMILMLILLFVLAWTVLRGTSGTVFSAKNCILFTLMLLLLAALVHTFSFGVEKYAGLKFFDIMKQMWNQGKGGGLIGGLISYGLQLLVAKPGTLIILIPATLVLAMVLFSLSIVRAGKKVAHAGGKVKGWFAGVVSRFRESDSKNKEKRKKAAEERARKKELQKEDDERGAGESKDSANENGQNGDDEEYLGPDGDAIIPDYYDGDADAARGVSDEHIEFVTARGRKKELFQEDLRKQKELHKAEERKIMSQEDDDEAYSGAGGTAAGSGYGGYIDDDESGETARRIESNFDDGITEIGEKEPLPAVDSSIPTKIPEKNDEIRVVTCNEEIDYNLPPRRILKSVETDDSDLQEQERNAKLTARKLEEVMRSFGIEARVIRISIGSTVTMFELQPQSGVKVSRIKNLSDDIALNLAASGVRILAPIPGKAAIGIEVPNEDRRTVYLKDLVESEQFQSHRSKLAFCLGEDISGDPIIADISKMPHVLIAGTTGSGKSVCINCIVMSLLYRCTPNDVRLIMIDPKVVELQVYNSIPHLLVPVVTEPKKAAAALSWTVQEMENRYKLFAKYNLRDITAYNQYAPEHGLPRMPRIVIIIDELADLMMVVRDSVEEAINRIAQKARAAGMHLIVATQRPSVDVITGLIKANIPSRIAFTVSSVVDSKTILDYGGAEKLLGRGDMLYHPVDFMKPLRVQGGFVSDAEIEETVEFLKVQKAENEQDEQISSDIDNTRMMEKPGRAGHGDNLLGDGDPMLADAVDIAIETKQISASFLQRKLGLGYSRASRLIDQMEEKGFISARDGNNPRQVLISRNPLR